MRRILRVSACLLVIIAGFPLEFASGGSNPKHPDPPGAIGGPASALIGEVIVNGTRYVPAQAVAAALGLYLKWEPGAKVVYLESDEHRLAVAGPSLRGQREISICLNGEIIGPGALIQGGLNLLPGDILREIRSAPRLAPYLPDRSAFPSPTMVAIQWVKSVPRYAPWVDSKLASDLVTALVVADQSWQLNDYRGAMQATERVEYLLGQLQAQIEAPIRQEAAAQTAMASASRSRARIQERRNRGPSAGSLLESALGEQRRAALQMWRGSGGAAETLARRDALLQRMAKRLDADEREKDRERQRSEAGENPFDLPFFDPAP